MTVESFEFPHTGVFDTIEEAFNYLHPTPRYEVSQIILSHPEMLISPTELQWITSSWVSDDELSNTLTDLQQVNVIDTYEPPNPTTTTDTSPSMFYGITEYGIKVYDVTGFLNGIGFMRELYQVVEKPDRIEHLQAAPRPEYGETEYDLQNDCL